MNRPARYAQTTDYGTLKNDDGDGVVVTMPAIILSAGQLYTVSETITVGTLNAASRARVASSKDGNEFHPGSALVVNRIGQIAGPTDVPYSVVGFLYRSSPTTVTAMLAVTNPYSEGMGMAFGSEVFTFHIGTFLSPFV